jgi:hypothetical protein
MIQRLLELDGRDALLAQEQFAKTYGHEEIRTVVVMGAKC